MRIVTCIWIEWASCQELNNLVDALFVPVHFPVASNEEFASHFWLFNLILKQNKSIWISYNSWLHFIQ